MKENEFNLIADFEEQEYQLSSIGIKDLILVFEYDIIYFYSSTSDFYLEINIDFIDRVLSNEHIILRDDMVVISFSVEQLDIIKNIFKDVVDDNYRQRLIRGI